MNRRPFGVSPSRWFLLVVIVSLAGALGAQTSDQVPVTPSASAAASEDASAALSKDFRVFTNTDGTGTATVLARWIDSDTLGDSGVQQVGDFIGVGPIAPTHVTRALTVDTGAGSGGFRIYRTSLTTFPYVDFLLMTTATPYASIQAGDSNAWRTLSLNPSGGSVGIGTTDINWHRLDVLGAPHVNGASRTTAGLYDNSPVAAGVGGGIAFGGNFQSSGLLAQQFGSIRGFKENATVGDYAGALAFNTRVNGGFPAERMRIDSRGYVGVGTTSPGAQLHVGGTPTQDVFAAFGGDVTTGPAFNMGYSGGSFGRSSAFFNVRPDALAVYPNPSIRFWTANVERIIITGTGNVGIGVVPAAAGPKLHVGGDILANGNISANGTIFAKYQDVAEWVPAKSDMLPGTVVILNPEVNNEVMPSSDRYDVRVAGVVSHQPGLILGVAGDSKEQIATTGRVLVKVDATAAPIRIGDLLVTSDKPGMAMRSDAIEIQGRKFHQPGTIIGKALEPLAAGEGEILVLLSLQ